MRGFSGLGLMATSKPVQVTTKASPTDPASPRISEGMNSCQSKS
jgi:hypothetical protein